MRTVHQLHQGSPDWAAHRALIFNASEAPVVTGASKYTTRSQLLAQKATGLVPEVDSHKQSLFDRGHAVEAPTILLIEDVIGDSLAPVVASIAIDGLTLGASYDGLTLFEDAAGEVKLWNEDLAAQIKRGELDPHYYWQLEQQFIVTPTLERIIFATSDGTRERFVYLEYRPVAGRREQLIAAWKQFKTELASYVPPAAAAPAVVAAPVQALPAVSVQVTGSIAIIDNFDVFETAMRDFLEHRLIREPRSDQDFADLDVQIKAMKGAEAALKAAEAQMLAQVESIDTAKKRKDMLLELVSDNRKMAEKLLASEKERRRGEIVAGGHSAIREHVAKLNERLGKPYMPTVAADFAGAIKGKSSLAKMEDAVASELARAKISANEIADRIDTNLRYLREHAKDHVHLFPDTATIVLKAADDLQALVTSRIAQHRAAEEKKEAETRERIRQEELARIEREAQEKLRAEQAEAARLQREQEARDRETARQAAEAAKPAPTPAPAVIAAPAPAPQAAAANSPTVVPMQTRAAPSRASAPTLTLGAISERLGFTVTADFIRRMGFEGTKVRAATLFHEADMPRMIDSIVAHLRSVQQQLQAA